MVDPACCNSFIVVYFYVICI